jgi:hypothetical protein
MLEGVGKVVQTGGDAIYGGGSGHLDVMWEPTDCVGITFASRFPCPDLVAPIMFERRANVPGVLAMRSPRAALVRFLVDENPCSGRTKRCAVVIEDPAELVPRG